MNFKYIYDEDDLHNNIYADSFEKVIKKSKNKFYDNVYDYLFKTFTVYTGTELDITYNDIIMNNFNLFFDTSKYFDKINFISDYDYIIDNLDKLNIYSDNDNVLFYPNYKYEIHFDISKTLLTLINTKLDEYQRTMLI